ncbi:hypothetical protein ABIQ69_01225 [Agromyces sp. G08B096]|uniref:DUF4337 domain-containing protein n=1 Tax=Agromyces sp. G08B096 TaxID=3156399 RepID=A0AAU7W6R6_9MICO
MTETPQSAPTGTTGRDADPGAPARDDDAERRTRRRRQTVDAIAVFLLSAVAVLTAWCGFQSSKWGGEMSIAFSQASSARVQAADHASGARDARAADQAIWVQWVLATDRGDAALASYIEQRFSPEFRVAFDAWNAGDREAQGPFAMPEYVPPGAEDAAAANARADARFEAALQNNQRGDDYSILTVLFALVLFLVAISQRDLQPWVRWTLLGLGVAVAAVGIVVLATFPVKI